MTFVLPPPLSPFLGFKRDESNQSLSLGLVYERFVENLMKSLKNSISNTTSKIF